MARFRAKTKSETPSKPAGGAAPVGQGASTAPDVQNVQAFAPSPAPSALELRWAGDPASWVPVGQEARFERLWVLGVRGGTKQQREAAARTSAAMQCRLPERAHGSDVTAARAVSGYLVRHVGGTPPFDVVRAFRRPIVDEYLERLATTGRDRGRHQIQGQLYSVGRLVHPHEYPPAKRLTSPRPRRHPAAGDRAIADWYAAAGGLSGEHRSRVLLLLDLALGAGARAREIGGLRGVHITEHRHRRRAVAVVTLPSRLDGARHVPILDPARSARVLERAAAVGEAPLFAPGVSRLDRNLCNRMNSVLVKAGHKPIDLSALRSRWLVDVAASAPAALLLQLSDVSSLEALSDVRRSLPVYGVRAALATLDGSEEPA